MSLLVWLPLDGDLKNKGLSTVNFKDKGATITTTGGKVVNGCYHLSSKTLANPNFTDLNGCSDFSASCWVKFTGFPSGSQAYCICLNNTSSTSYKFILGVSSSDGVTAKLRINASSKTDIGTLELNVWYHLAVCISGTTGYMYIDGELKKTVSGLSSTNATNLIIGGRSTNAAGTSFTGVGAPAYYNDVRVYNHCLTPREVKQLAQGLVLHYKLNNDNNTNMLVKSNTFNGKTTSTDPTFGFPVLNADNTSGTGYKDFASWSNFPVTLNEVYTVSFYAKSSSSSVLTMYFYNNTSGVVQVSNIKSSEGHNKGGTDGNCPLTLTPQWKKYWVTWTFASTGTDANKTLLFRLAAGGKCDVALPKLERGSVATPYGFKASEVVNPLVETDHSGFNNHGIRSTELSYVSNKESRYSNSTSFKNKERIRCNSFSTDGWTDLTMAAWVRPQNTANGTDINTIIIGGAYLAIRTSNNCATTYCYGMTPAGYHTGKTPLPIGSWSHIAAVWDSTNGVHKIYVNGQEDFSIACTGTASNGQKKDFGLENDSGRPYVGEMTDARIYATALSASDIKTLYESSAAMLENGVMQAYEFTEEPDTFNLKIHQTGNVKASDISEIGYVGGMKTKVLSDGSAWARIHWLDVTTDKTWFKDANEVAFCNEPNRFSRMGLVEHFKSYDLPKGYQALDYIESTGTQYIDTGYYWQSEVVKVVMDAAVISNASNQSLFGNEEPFSGGRYFSIVPHGSGGNFSFYVGSSTGLLSGSLALDTRFTMECSTSSDKKFTLKLQGTTVNTLSYGGTVMAYANTTSTHESKGKIYIFANHNSSTNGASPIQNIGGMKLYGFKMYDNNAIVRDFIPCKNANGAVGLYDKVFGEFYTSPNSEAFTAGPGATSNAVKADGIYEFMLTYPKLSATAFNRWTQASSPNASTVTGLRKITTAWSGHNGGIRKHGSACLYNCDTGSTWYAPIGQYSRWTETQDIPAANGSSQSETELWVRIDNLPRLNKISMLNEEYLQALNIHEL